MTTLKLALRGAIAAALGLGLASMAHAASYHFQVSAPGVRAGDAVGTLVALDSADFGVVPVGQAVSRPFRFTNSGRSPAKSLHATVTGAGLTMTSSSCGVSGAPVSLAAGQSCEVAVEYRPTDALALLGTLSISGEYQNSPASMSLSGRGALEARGVLTANTSPDFGALALGSSTSRSFTFRNTGNQAATGVAMSVTPATGLTMSANTCGTAAAPVTIAAQGACGITLAYGGATASSLAGVSLNVTGTFTGTPATVALAGNLGNFSAAGTWSTSPTAVVAPTTAGLSFGTREAGLNVGGVMKSLYVRSTGTNGDQAVGFILTGDTAHFTLAGGANGGTTLRILNSAFTNVRSCAAGSALAADKLSTVVPCLTTASFPTVELGVVYSPKAVGSHRVTLTPYTNNGTLLPEALTFSGAGAYDPAAAWSSYKSALTAPTPADLNFGTVAKGAQQTKYLYLFSTGTYSYPKVSLQLSGDTSQFKLTQVWLVHSSNGASTTCSGGIAPDGLSSPPCQAFKETPHLQIGITYAPTVTGSHSITVTPGTTNGTALPAPVTLTATAN